MSTPQDFDDPTPTQKIWAPVADLGQQHQAAFLDLQIAVRRGDAIAMKKAFDTITSIEGQQKQVHAEARAYLLKKLRE